MADKLFASGDKLDYRLTNQMRNSSMPNHKKKLHGLSMRANYTDRETAACRRSDCQLFPDRGRHVVSVTDPYDRILGFLDRSRYFYIK
jgi:hypothetical protein